MEHQIKLITDSMRAHKIYLACIDNAKKLKSALGNEFEPERKRIEELTQ